MVKKLFSNEQLQILTEGDVQELLADINPYLWAAVVNPFDDLQERRENDEAFRILDEGQTAQWLRPQIVHRAKRIFEHNDAMRCYTRRRQLLFEYKDAIAICFKKVTKRRYRGSSRLERSNYLTLQNKDYWQQRKLEGFPDIPRIIVGYELLMEMTDIGVLVGYPRTRQRGFQWIYNMANQDNALLRIVAEHQEKKHGYEDDAEDPGFIVRPRRMVREGAING